MLDKTWAAPAAEVTDAVPAAEAAQSVFNSIASKVWYFVLGGIGGGAGAFVVYPMCEISIHRGMGARADPCGRLI